MDMKDSERVVIAKPVASRPTCSNFRSFSELLAGAINAAPPNACSETAIAAIRPKTVRFKQTISRPSVSAVTSRAEHSGAAGGSSSYDKVVVSDIKPNMVYKPQAKLVSLRTVSLLANMGNPSNGQQRPPSSAETCIRHTNQERSTDTIPLQPTSNLHRSTPSRAEAEHSIEASKLTSQNPEDDSKALAFAADRPSYDGYNWRKYGQKQVKGSEYPRSYYKCTHPNCPVKKKVERSLDGQIAEIVYKGEHNHSKPQPPKRNSGGAQGSGLVADGIGQDASNQPWKNNSNDRNESSEVRIGNQIDAGLPMRSAYQCGLPPIPRDPSGTGSINPGVAGTPDNSCGVSGECDEGSKGLEGDDEEPRSKRKRENQAKEAGASTEALQDARVVVQSATDTEITGDGFRWRKYGQKVVKGNPYPRSYYRCTSLKCNVRKHVERASDDPRAFITTYEGKHNHDMPLRTSAPAAAVSEPDHQVSSSKDKP